MATSLGKVGIVDKGNYLQEETYNAGDFVLYNGSTWLALKDGILGVEPAEGTNWKYLARGFEAEVLSMIAANDTSGLIGEAGQQVNAQSLIDVIADKVATKLIEKGSIVNNAVTTVEGTVLDGRMGKALQDQITDVNNNIANGLVNLEIISSLSSTTQLTHAGYYDVLDISNTINDNVVDTNTFTDYSVGDFKVLLISSSFNDQGCRFGTLIITSPRFQCDFWTCQIWENKFVRFKKVTTNSDLKNYVSIIDNGSFGISEISQQYDAYSSGIQFSINNGDKLLQLEITTSNQLMGRCKWVHASDWSSWKQLI